MALCPGGSRAAELCRTEGLRAQTGPGLLSTDTNPSLARGKGSGHSPGGLCCQAKATVVSSDLQGSQGSLPGQVLLLLGHSTAHLVFALHRNEAAAGSRRVPGPPARGLLNTRLLPELPSSCSSLEGSNPWSPGRSGCSSSSGLHSKHPKPVLAKVLKYSVSVLSISAK